MTGASASCSGPAGRSHAKCTGSRQTHRQRRSPVARLPRHDGRPSAPVRRQARAGSPDAAVERVEHGESMAADGVMTRAEQRAQAVVIAARDTSPRTR